jgi:predicted O-methyltransferase YrrM
MKLDNRRLEGGNACEVRFRGHIWQVNYLYGLDDLCKEYVKPDFTVLELGTHNGVSTELFASYAKKVVGVDWLYQEPMLEVVNRNPNIEFHNKTFEKWSLSNKDKFDLIYIDGDHSATCVQEDILLAEQVVKPGGFISGHDFDQDAVNIMVTQHFMDRVNEIKLFRDSSWLIKSKT